MGIRIGITDGNREFFERFYKAFRMDYPEEFEVYLFPDLSRALKAIEGFHLKAVLLEMPEGTLLEMPPEGLPSTAFFARLCDRKQEEKEWEHRHREQLGNGFDEIPLLCRFRSAEEWRDLLLREIAALPGEEDKAINQDAHGGGFTGKGVDSKVVLFTSAAGGTGASSAARGFAEYCTRRGRHPLLLDLQTFPNHPGSIGDNLYTFEDVLLSLRGLRYAPDAVLERAFYREEEGPTVILPPSNPRVLFDMTGEEIITIVDHIRELRRFSPLVLDMTFDTSERAILPILKAEKTVLVSNGTQIANEKTKQLLDHLPAFCGEDPLSLYERVCLLYNRFPKEKGRLLKTEMPYKLGGVRELPIRDPEDLIGEISTSPAMERLYEFLYR